jgi:hypothetical protein
MNKLIRKYKNGNYTVNLYEDGTKVRRTEASSFIPEFAENMDIKITNKCSGTNCAWCHEGSSECGKHGNIMGERFIDTLKPGQEVALGGGNVLEHPALIPFLKKLRALNVIANITINQIHFEEEFDLVEDLIKEKLIYGLGISLVDPTDSFIGKVKKCSNAVIHVINGVFTAEECEKLCDEELKILILGYKRLRRGAEYLEKKNTLIKKNQDWLYDNLSDMLEKFNVVSFDNLAIEQLNVERLLPNEEWQKFYMGDDGTFTFYIDMIERKFAKSSTAPFNERYELLHDVTEMFNKIKS